MKLFYMILASLITVLIGKLCALVDRARRYAAAETLSAAFPTVFSFNHGIFTNFLAFHQIRRTK